MDISSSGLISGTPSNDDVGTHTVTAQVTDSSGLTDEVSFNVTISNENDAPEFDFTPQDMVTNEDASFTYQLSASDVDASDTADSLTYSGLSTPPWMDISSSGLISGTPSNDDVGTHTVTAQVTDSSGLTDEVSFSVTINNVNDDPTGELAIAGEAEIGWVLSPVNNISDEDGINTADSAGMTS